MARVNAPRGLNIRLGPGKDQGDVGNLPDGAVVEVLEGGTEEWAPIRLWAARAFLGEVGTAQEAPPGPLPAGDYDFSTKEGTMAAIAAECRAQGIGTVEQVAYVLATVEHESGFKPICERGPDSYFDRYEGREDLGNTEPGDGLKFKGRGYVQITGRANYTNFSRIVGRELVENPDLALEPRIALFILVHGFKNGSFTGKKITNYINDEEYDFYNARRCINGVDQAEKIAALAEGYLEEMEGKETPAPIATRGVPVDRVIEAAESLVHTDYRLGAEIKPSADPARVTLTDCSEIVEFACLRAGVKPVMPDGAMFQYAHCHQQDTVIPVAEGLETRGALLFKFSEDPLQCVQENRRPSVAHVAISLTDGETFEARSTAAGVGYFDDAREQNWTHAALIPGVDYGGGPA